MIESKRHRNPTAVVTGGASGLGREIVIALSQNGYDVAIVYNKSKKTANQLAKELNVRNMRVEAYHADISKIFQIENVLKKIYSRFHKIDLLVNNAAVINEATIISATEKSWDETLDTNLKGTFFASQAVVKYMLKQGGGKIINIGSLGGIKPFAYYIPYSISKAGVIMLTKCLAKSLAPNILVNSIAPGTIRFEETVRRKRNLKNEKNLLNKFAAPQDVTDLIVFLATKNRHITGQTFGVDGGSSII
jgi:NAD(P)-dependent dehydrogenase (short-subunit alcohol dehydrogenase family)